MVFTGSEQTIDDSQNKKAKNAASQRLVYIERLNME